MDRLMFTKVAADLSAPLKQKHPTKEVEKYLADMLEDMTENLQIFGSQAQPQIPGMPFLMPEGDAFQPYQVNLIVDNAEQKGPPVIVETYPPTEIFSEASRGWWTAAGCGERISARSRQDPLFRPTGVPGSQSSRRACRTGRVAGSQACLEDQEDGNSDLRPLLPVYDHGPQA